MPFYGMPELRRELSRSWAQLSPKAPGSTSLSNVYAEYAFMSGADESLSTPLMNIMNSSCPAERTGPSEAASSLPTSTRPES